MKIRAPNTRHSDEALLHEYVVLELSDIAHRVRRRAAFSFFEECSLGHFSNVELLRVRVVQKNVMRGKIHEENQCYNSKCVPYSARAMKTLKWAKHEAGGSIDRFIFAECIWCALQMNGRHLTRNKLKMTNGELAFIHHQLRRAPTVVRPCAAALVAPAAPCWRPRPAPCGTSSSASPPAAAWTPRPDAR